MSADFTPWPDDLARLYRTLGYWQGQTFPDWLSQRVQRHGARTAVIDARQTWTYTGLQQRSDALARGFQARGLAAGDRVVVQMPNCAEFLATVFALMRLGAWPVFALPAHRVHEISHFCAHTQAVACVMADQHAGCDYRALVRSVQERLQRGGGKGLAQVYIAGDAQEFTALDTVLAEGRALDHPLPAIRDASQVAFLQISGGSTGTPKLIPRTHDDYLYSVRASAAICGLAASTRSLCVLPAAHNFALSSPGVLGVLDVGGTVLMCPQPDPATALAWVQKHQATHTALVPALVPLWLEAARQRPGVLDTLQLIQVGGARLDDTWAQQLDAAAPGRVQQVFGMAEGLVNYTRRSDPPEQVLHTQGRPISVHDELLIVDDDDRPVAPGQTGHLLTRGPYTLRGYYRADGHNARAFTPQGYYRTGDRVRLTPQGNLVVEGRSKDQINRGGEKIAAEEMETLLRQHADIADAAVVAQPDAVLGEKSCAFVVTRQPLKAPAILAFVRALGVARYKVPDRIEFIDALPKTAVGKIDKKALRSTLTPS